MNGVSFDLGGKAALVTGGGRGLGFALVGALHRAGAAVAVNDLTAEICDQAIARLGGGPRLAAGPADLATEDGPALAVRQAAGAFGRLDILINNAAVNVERPTEQTDDAHWDRHLDVVLGAPFFAARAALPLLEASRGSIVNIASELGLHAMPDNVAYVSAKHGLLALTRALAVELAPAGVRVNALCPGAMDTELMRDCAEASGDPAAYYRSFETHSPMGRLTSPAEIAAFALCLVSPSAAFMTGAAIAIDGGSTAGRR
jgi:NAD(P)-dependent dehydrogenase (short-subunit alcohol dehydrogenase family)